MRNLMKTRIALLALLPLIAASAIATDAIDIGARLELMVDDTLIDESYGLERRLHQPTPREVAIVHDEPWEGNSSGYHTVFQDVELYRMYYRGHQYVVKKGEFGGGHREV